MANGLAAERTVRMPKQVFENSSRRQEIAARRETGGDDRFAAFLLRDDSEFQPIYELAERQNLQFRRAYRYEIMNYDR